MQRLGLRISYASHALRGSVGLASSVRHCASSSNNIDPTEVEWVSSGSASSGSSSSASRPHFVDVVDVDAYARARVINFAKRYAKVDGSDGVFSINEVRLGDQTLFHCKVRLPIPGTAHEASVVDAEGIACNAKDAEILASMHAEYTIDALGYHIYTLPSMQRKHADAARKAGRWAPMPEDMAKIPSEVSLPLPLRRVLTDDESEGGTFVLLDTTITQFRPNPYAIISPCLLEPMSLHRLRACFHAHAISFDQHTSVREVCDPVTKTAWMVTTLRLPHALGYQCPFVGTEGMLTAIGKAKDRHISLVLAAMHAELVLDAYGAQLFPHDPDIQDRHANAAIEYGRWAPTTKHAKSGSSVPSIAAPLPLKQLCIPQGVARVSLRTEEEEWVRSHVALARETNEFVTAGSIDTDCLPMIKRFLASKKKGKTFLFESVGSSVKATVVLPVPPAFGVRGGVGLAMNAADAEMLAANHAVNVLCALNIEMFGSVEERNLFIEKRKAQNLSTPNGISVVDPATRSPAALRRGRVGSVVNVSAPNQGAAEKPEEPTLDYRAFQTESTRELWNLSPDFQDFIMVDDRARGGAPLVTLQHTLYSPRRVDPSANDRLVSFLASVGKRLSEVMTTKRIEDQVSRESYQCIVNIPLPTALGDRLAVGVAPDQREAQTLAAMHAELILDTLGVPLYAQPDFQRKHATAAAKLGRRAPWPGANHENPSTPSPPYLKKSSPEEASWIRMVQARGSNKVSTMDTSAASRSTDHGNDDSDIDNVTAVALGMPKRLAFIAPEDVDYVSKLRVQYYLRRARAPQDPSVERLTFREATTHISRLRIPVPERFGDRFAVGVGSKEKEADALLFMNAERLLDTLGIHIFNLPGLQNRHAHRVRALGRWAPLMHEVVTVPASTPSPLPLSVGDSIAKPRTPTCPSPADLQQSGGISSRHLWKSYAEACELYIEAFQKREANLAYQNERVPRTGLQLIDDALDEVDGQEVNNNIKHLLTQYCFRMNVPYPILWKSRSVGPVSRRVFLTTVEVPGLEHIQALGCAANREQANRKAAMHICALLRRIEPDFVAFERDEAQRVKAASESKGEDGEADASRRPNKFSESIAAKRAAEEGSWSSTSKAFTNDGKVRVIELFTVCFGLQPPVVLNKQRTESNVVTYSTTVELTDEDGKTWVGKADTGGRKGNAADAYNDLFDQLQANAPGFQSLAELVRNHSHLDPEHVVDVSFGEDLRIRMKDLVDRRTKNEDAYDDDDDEVAAVVEERNSKADVTTECLTSKLAAIDKEEIVIQSNALKKQHLAKIASPEYQERFAAKRKSLSIHEHKREIVSTIANHQVTVVCGTTGCGKTTQLPQFILDDATERGVGGEVSMIITQPRRLSAVSIAQRIATERLESVGDSCGYTIRLDSKPGRNINFVTSGVLLRLFHSSPTLEGINYVIIDEIHERDINSDFLLILVRDLIRTRKDLRVVLMSATLSSDQFASFFGGAPVINVVGHVHPVQELFLEELAAVADKQRRLTPLLKQVIDQQATASKTRELKEALGDAASSFVLDLNSGNNPKNASQKYGFLEATGDIDYLAVQFAIDFALDQLEEISDSSILVFLPGWNEIVKAKEVLGRNTKYHIITLHSSVSSDEQMQCFQPPPEGKVKLILSTNIAESGVTIDDIAVVIDLGRAKEKSYVTRRGKTSYGRNEMGSMSQLVTVYASRANCVQRRGRVGRTRPGVCIRLYSKAHFDTVHDFQTPEMLRQPLDALCLQILALGLGDPVDFLRQAIEPPSFNHVEGAMRRLHELGGVTTKGYLTPLGLHLAKLPVAPRIGKMILVGAVLRCLDSALTIAACSDTDVYNSSREVRDAVKAHREDLSDNTFSDHISSINGFNYWVTAHYTKTPQEVMIALQDRQLSVPQLLTVSRYKKQFFEILCHHGFLPDANAIMQERRRDPTCRGDIFVEKSRYSEDSTDVGLVKSMIGSGLFPNICMYRGKKVMRSKLENRLAPASSSVVAQTDPEHLSSPFFVFEEVVKQAIDVKVDRLILRGVSGIPLWAVLLMGTSSMPVAYRDDLNLGIIDDWILFRASFHTLDLIRRFKREFHRCLTRKFIAPNDDENSQRLEEFRLIIKELVGQSLRPNELVATSWEEKGSIVRPQTEPLPQSESASSGDVNAAGESPIPADSDDQ